MSALLLAMFDGWRSSSPVAVSAADYKSCTAKAFHSSTRRQRSTFRRPRSARGRGAARRGRPSYRPCV